VFDSEGYHFDLLVIHLFKRKKTYLRIVTDNKISVDRFVQKAARKLENLELLKLPYERWVVYLCFGLMAVIVFQVFILYTTVFTRMILKYAQKSSRAVLHVEGVWKGCILQTVKMREKN
jgi:hypothetical protein